MKLSWARCGKSVWRLLRDERSGSTAIEYAIIAAGIAVVIVSAVSQIGTEVVAMFTRVLPGLT